MKSKREQLKDKVVALVKEFVKTEGGITFTDLESLFGRDSGFMTAISAILKITF
jgi:cyanate lyase